MKNIETSLVELLIEKKLKLSTAESCTGGLIAQKITSVPGASECFDCGVVTYSNEQKQKLLGVSAETLEKYGAVSRQTALEMCKGVKNLANSDFGISVTGIAGPGGGTPEKPVGTVWIGICGESIHKAEKFLFDGDRTKVRESTAEAALTMVDNEIKCK
ncbi:MAG: CinA family protein [Ruminococcaceae bacterium]|nr:CinA family protein [Oscillospiraceae bacterium]